MGDSVTPIKLDVKLEDDFHECADDGEEPMTMPDIKDSVDSTSKVINQQHFYDRLINAEVELQLGDLTQTGKVIGRSVGPEWAVEGSYGSNPMINSLLHDVGFHRQGKEHSANVIVESMLRR